MQVKQCNADLASLGFPSNGKLPVLRQKVALVNLTAHECKVNHAGKPIKSMESEVICELTNDFKNKGFVSAQLAVDGDATLINHLQK